MNRHCVSLVGPFFGSCLDDVQSNHSDTEVGRCMMKHGNAECIDVPGFLFKQMYYQQEGDMVYPMKQKGNGQMELRFPTMPKETHFAATMLHPLKRAEDFYHFRKQCISYLRPLQVQISKLSDKDAYRLAMNDMRTTCVHNNQLQLQMHHFPLNECGAPERQEHPEVPLEAYVLYLLPVNTLSWGQYVAVWVG